MNISRKEIMRSCINISSAGRDKIGPIFGTEGIEKV
jgi:hypothetical protein